MMTPHLSDPYQRIIERSSLDANGCLICTYSVGSHGYCQVWDGRTVTLAHRIVWMYHHGPIPPGLTVDHICHVQRCMNPEHLRLLPNRANASDNGMTAFRTSVDVGRSCHRGHPLVRSLARSRTYCRECAAERKQVSRNAASL